MRSLIVIAHDIRSTHNVGSLLRTCEGLGVDKIYFTGYTPYPKTSDDDRLPHISDKLTKQIEKTALGATEMIDWQQHSSVLELIDSLKKDGYQIAALEQTPDAVELQNFKPTDKLVLLLGREVEGIEPELIDKCDTKLVIPMFGQKESFNVVQAAAMALFHARFA